MFFHAGKVQNPLTFRQVSYSILGYITIRKAAQPRVAMICTVPESTMTNSTKEDDMEKMTMRDLMVPTDDFPKISDTASLYDALTALEKAQEAFLSGKSPQRILLVENQKGQIIGKISPIDLFRGLEKKYNEVNVEKTLDKFGLKYIWSGMRKDFNLWESPFRDLCRKAADVHVKDFVNIPNEGQSVNSEDSLSKCFHLFVVNRHDTLFVMDNNAFIGMLRFSDVYKEVSQTMKECTF
jgi:CBS domain containing-hemolysin-like protein